MATNQKLSEALKGNTNAAKNHVKKGMTAIQNAGNNFNVQAGKAFASAKNNVSDKWESVDKTVKYAAIGAVAGAANAAVGNVTSKLILDKIKTTSNAAKIYGAVGGTLGAVGSSKMVQPVFPLTKEKATVIGAGTLLSGVTAASIGAAAFKGAQIASRVNPAVRIGIGAIGGAAAGGYLGYKADRAEEKAKRFK